MASHIEWWSGLTTADRIGDLSEELLLLPVPSQGVTMTYAHSGRTIVCRKPDIAAELRRAEGFCHDWLLGAVSFLAQAMLHGTVYRIAFEENAGALILGAYPEGARMYFREESGRLMLVKLELLLGPIGGH